MNPDVLLKVIAYAAVPLVMAWIGNHLASKVVEDRKVRNMYRAAFILLFLFGVSGTWVVEYRSDSTHHKELNAQSGAIEGLRATIQLNEIRHVSDMGYLKAKLEDAEKMNEKLSQFAPAIMKLARTSEEFTRKQYETKVTSDKELHDFTMGVVSKIRQFSHKYQLLELQQSDELMNSMRQPQLTEAEKQQRWNEGTQKTIQLSYGRNFEFRDSILPDAIYAKNELLKRKVSEPALEPMQKSDVDMVMRGILAGAYPELALADYLELMAKQLSPK